MDILRPCHVNLLHAIKILRFFRQTASRFTQHCQTQQYASCLRPVYSTSQKVIDCLVKCFQSTKGIEAKRNAGIHALSLPPRTPCWMPLDYAIWQKIVDKMLKTEPSGKEAKAAFISRLHMCAKSLPRGFVAKTIAQMKERIQSVLDAKGYNPKVD